MSSSLISTQSSLPSETVASPRSLSLDALTSPDETLLKVVPSESLVSHEPVPPDAPLETDALGADVLTMQGALPSGALEALSAKDVLPLEVLTPVVTMPTKVLSSQGALASKTLTTLPSEAPGSPTLLPFDIVDDVISSVLQSAGNAEPTVSPDTPVTSNLETFASECSFLRANSDQEPVEEKGGSFEFVAAGQPVAASSQSLPVVPMELVAASSAVSFSEADADPLLLDQTDATSKDEQIVSNESPLLVPSNLEDKMCPERATLCAVKDTGDEEKTLGISKVQGKIVEKDETVVGVPSEVETKADVDVTSGGQALQQTADREEDIQSPDAVSDQNQQVVSAEELAERDNAFASVVSSSSCQYEASTSSLTRCASSGIKSSSTLEEEDGTKCEPSTSFSSLQKTSSAQGGSHCVESTTEASNLTELSAEKVSSGQEQSYSCTFPNVLKELSRVVWIKRDPCFRLVGSRQCKYEKGARICVDLYIPLDLVDTLPGKVGSDQCYGSGMFIPYPNFFPPQIPDPHQRI